MSTKTSRRFFGRRRRRAEIEATGGGRSGAAELVPGDEAAAASIAVVSFFDAAAVGGQHHATAVSFGGPVLALGSGWIHHFSWASMPISLPMPRQRQRKATKDACSLWKGRVFSLKGHVGIVLSQLCRKKRVSRRSTYSKRD